MADVTADRPRQFDLTLRAHGLCRAGAPVEVAVTGLKDGSAVQLYPPPAEGQVFEAGDAAFPALALLAAAVVSSLLVQIRLVATAQDTPLGAVVIEASFSWCGTRIGAAPYQTRLDALQIAVSIDAESSAGEGRLLQLLDAARQGCFIQQTLLRANPIAHRLRRPGGWTSF